MACTTCNQGYGSGNPVSGIPVKVGAPMSTANQRAVVVGSIPQVLNMPWFTLVGCSIAVNKQSNGGIDNPASFFKYRTGYASPNVIAGSTCA